MHQNETQVFRQTQNVFYHSDAEEVPDRTDLRAFLQSLKWIFYRQRNLNKYIWKLRFPTHQVTASKKST